MGILLSFVAELSGSVWPAAFMHAVFNAQPSVLSGFMNWEKADPVKALFTVWGGWMIALLVFSVIVMIVWKKKRRE